MQTQENSSDLLIHFDNSLVRADTGKRFLNYIIDVAVFYVLVFGVGILLVIIFPSSLVSLEDDSFETQIVEQLFAFVFYALYMSAVEAVFKGKSLGKLITRTRAVNMNGSPISIGTAFARGFSRAVPFCVFSAFGSPCNPWQDRWTDTMVVDERQSLLDKEMGN